MYYLRSRPAVNAIQFTVDQKIQMAAKAARKGGSSPGSSPITPTRTAEEWKKREEDEAAVRCSLQNKEACLMCSA